MTMPFTPFDLSIMKLDESKLARVPRIRTAEIYDGIQTQFHPEGLFSTMLFGAQGTQERDYTFGYIKLNTEILHPIIYRLLVELKADYGEIIKGKLTAIFNEKTQDFEKSDDPSAQTGYAFFMSKLNQLKPKESTSTRRSNKLKVIEKYKDRLTLKNHLVLPAGLRDIKIEIDERQTIDEINTLYQSLINYSNNLEAAPKVQGKEFDNIRLSMQMKVQEIFTYIEDMMTGKKGFLMAKWGSRNLFDSAANVISCQNPLGYKLGDPTTPDIDTTQIGLFQACITTVPLQVFNVRNSEIFRRSFPNAYGNEAELIDSFSLSRKRIQLDDKHHDRWTSVEGISKVIHWLHKPTERGKPIIIAGCYLALIYQDQEKYQILMDINELPEGWNKKLVRPMTYYEFFYLINLESFKKLKLQSTRYPVAGDGSVSLSKMYVKTTTEALRLKEYVNGEPTGNIAYEYPLHGSDSYINTIVPSSTKLAPLGGDLT